MKKILSLMMAMIMLLSLTACGGKSCGGSSSGSTSGSGDGSVSEPEVYTNTPVDISGQEDEFTKTLVPLNYGPGDVVEDSLYYASITKDDGVFYMVQPEDEDEPMYIPVSEGVIYLIDEDEECRVTKTSFDYTPEGGETTHITQYRIFATLNSSSISVTGDGVGSSAQPLDSTEFDIGGAPENGGDTSVVGGDSSQANG